jgi:hypothetical protein
VVFLKRTTFWLFIAGGIILAYALYQFHRPRSDLNVEPHAAEEIEKAQRR